MSRAEYEAIAVDELRIFGVVDEVVGKKRITYRRATERKSGVSAVRFVDGFGGKNSYGVYGKLLNVVHFYLLVSGFYPCDYFCMLRSTFNRFFERGNVESVELAEVGKKQVSDFLCAADKVAFDIYRHNRVVNAHTYQKPAFERGNRYANALVIVGSDDKSGVLNIFYTLDDRVAVLSPIFGSESETDFERFFRFVKVGDKVGDLFALFFEAGVLDDYSGDEVRAVVEEVILFERGVTARFYRRREQFIPSPQSRTASSMTFL